MVALPALGNRVSLRYRLSVGELTDVIGFLEAVEPALLIRTKSDGIVEVSPDAVVAVKVIPHRPVRTPRSARWNTPRQWPGPARAAVLDGWFLRAGHGATSRANSAVPLDFSATLAPLPAIVDWYGERGLPGWLALPERLLPVRAAGVKASRVLVRDVVADPAVGTDLSTTPDAAWLATYQRAVPVDVLTAVVDGEVVFASVPGAAVGRGAVTADPNGHRWLGISAVRVDPDQRRTGHARRVCAALLAWGADRGAQRAYVQVLDDNDAAVSLYASLGFRLHHSHRYVEAASLLPGRR